MSHHNFIFNIIPFFPSSIPWFLLLDFYKYYCSWSESVMVNTPYPPPPFGFCCNSLTVHLYSFVLLSGWDKSENLVYSSVTPHNDRPRAEHFEEASTLISVPPLYSLESILLFLSNRCEFAFFREYAKAKKCSRDVIDSDCNYPSETKELLDLLYDAYNPFCADNRDPGATKNSPCSGVVIEKDANAAAGTKHSVFQALMFAFFLFLFLFKA